jgi:hypothetical protein
MEPQRVELGEAWTRRCPSQKAATDAVGELAAKGGNEAMMDIAPVLAVFFLIACGLVALVTHVIRRAIRLMKGGEPGDQIDWLLITILFLSCS